MFGGTILRFDNPVFKVRETFNHFEALEEPLYSRAWTFQERLVSRSLLFYTSAEMVWECKNQHWCECGHPAARTQDLPRRGPLDFYDTSNNAEDDVLLEYWRQDIVEYYTGTKLTFGKDRLPAL